MSVKDLDSLLERAGAYARFMESDLSVGAPSSKDSFAVSGEMPPHLAHLKQPSLLVNGQLKTYQIVGVHWLIQLFDNGANGILADEMGLGKTVQTIGLLAHLWEQKLHGPFLIVAPLSTLSNWVNEISKWCPSLTPVLYHGNKVVRSELQKDFLKRYRRSQTKKKALKKVPVLVTSYEVAIRDSSFLQQVKWRYLVVDEAHRLKNFECLLIRELRQLHTDNRLLLTGTPLQNNLTELWSLLNFILPDVFDNLDNFKHWFDFDTVLDDEKRPDESVLSSLVQKLHRIIRPFMLRRLKSDVESLNIPQKKELFLYCGFSEEQETFYKLLRARNFDALGNGARTSVRNLFMQLRKTCNHPFLLDDVYDDFHSRYVKAKAQGQSVADILRQEQELERKIAAENDQRVDRGRLRKRLKVDYTDAYVFGEIDRLLADPTLDIYDVGNYQQKAAAKAPPPPNAPKPPSTPFFLFLAEQRSVVAQSALAAGNDKSLSAILGSMWRDLDDKERQKYSVLAEQDKARFKREQVEYLNTNNLKQYVIQDAQAYLDRIVASSGKMQLLDKMLPVLKAKGHKVLIFSQMTRLLDILEDYVDHSGHKYCRIDGSTPQAVREEQIRAFNDVDEGKFVFLLSTRAGGLGINLTSADTVFIYDSDFNPQMDLQAQDRVHRLGQTKPVAIFRLAVAQSVESRVLYLATKKLKLDRLVAVDRKKVGLGQKELTRILNEDMEQGAFGSRAAVTETQLELLLDRARMMKALTKKPKGEKVVKRGEDDGERAVNPTEAGEGGETGAMSAALGAEEDDEDDVVDTGRAWCRGRV
eukprot:TRINITY_DN3948_c0_g1_i1.p1 TRINITY_DN3948_c0_g1~~TRINITY_DN3948_c0_g1_i1.p1  ORF type:complete len:811 (-),score=128.48 TRINITY_DN3948_c0_g1_i1:318-2750(-)